MSQDDDDDDDVQWFNVRLIVELCMYRVGQKNGTIFEVHNFFI